MANGWIIDVWFNTSIFRSLWDVIQNQQSFLRAPCRKIYTINDPSCTLLLQMTMKRRIYHGRSEFTHQIVENVSYHVNMLPPSVWRASLSLTLTHNLTMPDLTDKQELSPHVKQNSNLRGFYPGVPSHKLPTDTMMNGFMFARSVCLCVCSKVQGTEVVTPQKKNPPPPPFY